MLYTVQNNNWVLYSQNPFLIVLDSLHALNVFACSLSLISVIEIIQCFLIIIINQFYANMIIFKSQDQLVLD